MPAPKSTPPTKPKRGRPPHAVTADTHYTVNVTQGERALIDAAAMAEDGERYPSRWVRKVALREAKRIVEGAARPERKAR